MFFPQSLAGTTKSGSRHRAVHMLRWRALRDPFRVFEGLFEGSIGLVKGSFRGFFKLFALLSLV